MRTRPRSKALIWGVVFCCLTIVPGAVWAHKEGQAKHQLYKMGDLKLESGQVIKDFAISYVTHGTLNAKKSNVILTCSSLVGNHHRIDFLIGPGKALDTDKYFIVCIDAIGNGLTTSPSNSTAQPGTKFPAFNLRDMVQSQYRLLTEHLGVKHMVAVAGASMGGMQALQWAVSYPNFMDAVVAMTPAGKTPAWTVAIMKATNDLFQLDPAFEGGNYKKQPEKAWRAWTDFLLALGANAPEGLEHLYPHSKDAPSFLKWWEDLWVKTGFDANDCIYQQNAIIEHDVGTTPGFNGDYLKALKSIKARVGAFPAKGDVLLPPFIKEDAKFIKNAQVSEIPTLFGHFGASDIFSRADVLYINTVARTFLDDVTDHGKKLE